MLRVGDSELQLRLTGEHPVSRTALNYLSAGARSIGVSSHAWQQRKDEIEGVGISSLTSNMLCARATGCLGKMV
jgi:hypothetical protein